MSADHVPSSLADVAYREHPAFAAHRHCSPSVDAEFDVLGNELDTLAETARTSVPAHFLKSSRRTRQALAQAIERHTEKAERTSSWLKQSVEEAVRLMQQDLQSTQCRQQAALPDNPVQAALSRDGAAAMDLPAESSARWQRALADACEQLRRQAQQKPVPRQVYNIDPGTGVGAEIVRTLRDCGAWEVAERYQGRQQHLAFLDLHYSHSAQSWYKDCYRDLGLPTARCSYFHSDYHPSALKMVFYLHPLTRAQGPFSYLLGSHLESRSLFRHLLARALEAKHAQVLAPPDDGYYRPYLRHVSERQRFAQLPKLFQRVSHFGDDVLDEHPLAQRLLAAEHHFQQPDTVVIFDGHRGYHRGGTCETGERFAVHVGLDIPRTTSFWQYCRKSLGSARRSLARLLQ
jgi:hypothetical protein